MFQQPTPVPARNGRGRIDERGWERSGGAAGLLRVPLFHKILLSNALLVLLVAVGSTMLAMETLHPGSWRAALGLLVLIGVGAAVVTAPLYGALLRVALSPLEVLERTAERVERGEGEARAAVSSLADPRLARLTVVFNQLLDSVAADRRRLRQVAARAFRAQETERTRIAREIQEESVQTLAALLIRLRVARQAPEGPAKDAMLDEVRRGLVEATDGLRGFARALHSTTLADLGVGAAVEAYARTVAGTHPLRLTVDAQDVRGCLSRESELALYRILQEALSNAARHAGATAVRVTLRREVAWVEAVVEDDGRGFDVRRTEEQHPALGLFGMQERALYAGGALVVESESGAGTRVRVRIPSVTGAARDERPLEPCDVDHSAGGMGAGDSERGRPAAGSVGAAAPVPVQ